MNDDRGATERLAQFVVEWRPKELPRRALVEAKRALTDILGVIMVGSREPAGSISADIARSEGGQGPAMVIGHGFRTSASLAAFANGTAGHALDFDASATIKTTGHPTVCVAPAALAAAESVEATGHDLIEAMIVGFEIVSRVGRAGGGDTAEFYRRGFHGTSAFGVFGATAAAARLLGLDVPQTQRAFGIAASGAKGIRANYGTMTKPLHAGEANRTGLTAAMLALRGFSANTEPFEARFGWADAVTSRSFDPSTLSDGLGAVLAIEQGVNFKRFPSGGASHAAIRAMLQLMRDHDLQRGDIAHVEVAIGEVVVSQTLIYPWPSSGLEGKFSLAFTVAAAWADGEVVVDTFTDEKVAALDPYRSRITVIGLPGRPPATVRVRTTDGRDFVHEEPVDFFVDDGNGRHSGLSDDDLRSKLRSNVAAVRSPERADALLVELDHLEHATSLVDLSELLR